MTTKLCFHLNKNKLAHVLLKDTAAHEHIFIIIMKRQSNQFQMSLYITPKKPDIKLHYINVCLPMSCQCLPLSRKADQA